MFSHSLIISLWYTFVVLYSITGHVTDLSWPNSFSVPKIWSCMQSISLKNCTGCQSASGFNIRSCYTFSNVVPEYMYISSLLPEKAFYFMVPSLWNKLPITIPSPTSINMFKKRLKFHLFIHWFLFLSSVFFFSFHVCCLLLHSLWSCRSGPI